MLTITAGCVAGAIRFISYPVQDHDDGCGHLPALRDSRPSHPGVRGFPDPALVSPDCSAVIGGATLEH